MVRLARITVALPGKMSELMAALKETAEAVKAAAGVEVMVFASMGAQVGEFISVTNYDSLADFEEKGSKVLASPAYQAAIKKFEGLAVPGASRDHLLRQV